MKPVRKKNTSVQGKTNVVLARNKVRGTNSLFEKKGIWGTILMLGFHGVIFGLFVLTLQLCVVKKSI